LRWQIHWIKFFQKNNRALIFLLLFFLIKKVNTITIHPSPK
jgi:hypothetical protein